MKKLIVAACVGLTSLVAFGQGQVVLSTSASGTYAKFSNTVSSTFFGGSSVYIGLYWAADQATLASGGGTLALYAGTNSVTGGFNAAGTNGTGLAIMTGGGFVATTTFGGNRFTSLAQAGQTTYFQLRAWSAGYSTYADALASGSSSVFVSRYDPADPRGFVAPIVTAQTSASSSSPVNTVLWNPTATAAAQAISIAMDPVPEPSTIALVGLGLAGLIFIRRRK
jgi:hypothetical protein